jgi:hypothetical protein
VKCCAFQPIIANFYIGAMLEAGESPFRDLGRKGGFQPIGLIPTRAFREELTALPEEKRRSAQACAFYDLEKRACSIWNYRPAECSFYFCTEDPARERWSEQAFALETNMAQMALAHLGFSAREIAAQVDYLNDPPPDLPEFTRSEAEDVYLRAWRWVITQTEACAWQG